MATQYGTPSRITVAKVLLIIGLLAVTYLGLAFVPPYLAYWRADAVLHDEATRLRQRRSDSQTWEQLAWESARRLRDRLVKLLKVEQQDLHVSVRREKRVIDIQVEWKAQARFLFTSKTKVLRFKREVRTEKN